jgi:hypothetical protein
MALMTAQMAVIEKLFSSFCEKRVPVALRSEVRMGYRVKGNAVVLFEERPRFERPDEWHEIPIAKFHCPRWPQLLLMDPSESCIPWSPSRFKTQPLPIYVGGFSCFGIGGFLSPL